MPKVGVKLCFILGTLFSGICSFAFGLLNMVDDYTTFTALSFVIRGFEALGASAYSTAGYVIIVNIFPEHSGAVRGLLETFVGLGMSAGPAIGGLLYAEGWRFWAAILCCRINNNCDSSDEYLPTAQVRQFWFWEKKLKNKYNS